MTDTLSVDGAAIEVRNLTKRYNGLTSFVFCSFAPALLLSLTRRILYKLIPIPVSVKAGAKMAKTIIATTNVAGIAHTTSKDSALKAS